MADEEEQVDGSNMSCNVVNAAYYGSVDAILFELRQGGDVDELDPKEGWRPLHAAVMTESEDAAAYLIKMRATVNSAGPKGMTPLHYACRDNSADMVRILLAARADLESRDTQGKTPAELAAASGATRSLSALEGRADGSTEEVRSSGGDACPAPAKTTVVERPRFSSVPMVRLTAPTVRPHAAAPVVAESQPVAEVVGAPAPAAVLSTPAHYGKAVDPENEANLFPEVDESWRMMEMKTEAKVEDADEFGWGDYRPD
mmetsp:Transcript_50009/g.88080  ORF Transcript_50009/g.88080 Transcript_50009/m.88080 type:complete len:258 (+) Transcript_50009:57-830(+)